MRNARGKGGMHDGSAFYPYFNATSRACARGIGMSQESINQEAAGHAVSYGDEVTRVAAHPERRGKKSKRMGSEHSAFAAKRERILRACSSVPARGTKKKPRRIG
jgi:hypothetical protein